MLKSGGLGYLRTAKTALSLIGLKKRIAITEELKSVKPLAVL
jgi:hypothetical protein